MSYPTPQRLRDHADTARQLAKEYRREGNTLAADRREADAEFYDFKADCEEERLARLYLGDIAA